MGYPHYSGDCDEYHCLVRCFNGPENTYVGKDVHGNPIVGLHRHGGPRIVCLCGSTRFKEEILAAAGERTRAGEIVVMPGMFGHVDMPDVDWSTGGSALKIMLDELHKRKIDLADYVYVIDVDGYIGESTRSEIEYAESIGRPVIYLSGKTEESISE